MPRHVRARLALAGLACALAPLTARAQGVTRCEESADSPLGRNEQICAEERSRRTFSLFGIGDNAVAGLKTSAPDATFAVSNSDIGDQATLGTGNMMWLRSLNNIGGANSSRFFEIHFYATAAQGDFLKARDTTQIASLQNVRGGGWSFMSNTAAGGEGDFHSGHDGTIGVLFSGEKSAPGSCLDQNRSFIGNGRTLLAISDCEPTWPELNGQRVWRGAPYLSQDSWIEYQSQVGRPNMTFDFWKVPASLADSERRFIGTSAQTYGITSDHGRETRERFGNVIPGGRGDPRFDGYPLGLDYVWDAMTFNVTSVGRLMVVQVKVVNNSAEVYGKGIDYDSLYIGLATRWLNGNGQGVGRRANVHALPQLGAVVANELGRTSNCDGAIVPSYILSAGCSGQVSRSTAGFRVGATGVIYFKSPIGDLRNKLFTNPGSPFYNPSHPNAGDTITFNRMSLCGFDCANVQFVPKNMQRSFGTIAARERESLAGRPAPQNTTNYDWWALFKPYTGLDSRVDLSNPRAGGGYNYCVVDGWNYTNRPTKAPAPTGGDTLFYDTCNPTTNTMVGLWADTLPDRSINWAFNNTWSGAGPFPLQAGDTAGFVFGIIAAPDSAQFMSLLRNSVDFYQEFYLGPGIPSAPAVRSAAILGGPSVRNPWQVRLTLDYSAAFRPDPSIPNTVRKMREAVASSEEGRLLALNPWLADSIAAKASGLIDTIYVFKSCNGGQTFTATRTRGVCRTDRAINQYGLPVGTGWQAYATLTRDANGNFPARYQDAFVQGGQKYLYSFVAHRPALEFTVVDSGDVPAPGGGTTRGLITRTYTILEAASSPLKVTPGDPSVVEIYVPVSDQAGESDVAVTANVVGPTPLTYHRASVTTVGNFDTPLNYTVYFGDTAIVQLRDGLTRGYPDSTTVTLIRSARVGFNGSTAVRRLRDTLVFRTNELIPFAGGTGTTVRSTERIAVGATDSVAVTTIRYSGLVSVVAEDGTMRPFFVSANYGSAFQPALASGLVNAPPLLFTVADSGGRLAAGGRFWSQPGIGVLRSVSNPDVTFLTDAANFSATGTSYGDYKIAWRDGEFGPGQPFTLNFANPDETRQQVTASLQGRVRADSTRLDQATIDAINATLGRTLTADSLVRLYVPFTVRNAVLDTTANVTLAALRSSVQNADGSPRRFVLGSGRDTISVAIPDGIWVPGTPLIFVENVPVVDTVDGRPREDGSGRLVYTTMPRVTISRATIGCLLEGSPLRCNPVRGRGETDYIQVRAQQTLNVRLYNPFTAETEVAFTVQPPQAANADRPVTRSDLERVKVVPNPYVVTSSYEQGGDIKRLLFTNVPPQGIIRIYTVAGVFVQQLTWTQEMLNGNGDLFWDMRSREGFDVAPGLYLFTVEATGPGGGAKKRTPGRFIIIR